MLRNDPVPRGLLALFLELDEVYHGLILPYRYKALYGGRGSGKSYAAIVCLLVLSYYGPIRVACAREFMVTLAQSVREVIVSAIKKAGIEDDWIIQDSWIHNKKTGAHFFFIGLARNPDNIKSLEGVTICLVEEGQTISDISLEYLYPTIRGKGCEIWFVWNPRNEDDPVNEYFRGEYPPEDAYIRFTSWRNNPSFVASPMYADMLRDKRRDKQKADHTWEGAYRKTGDAAILTNWSEGTVELPASARPMFGIDWGYAPDPMAFVKCYELPNNVLYIAAENYGYRVADKDVPAFVDKIPEARRYQIRADNDPRLIASLQASGFKIIKAKKGPGSVEAGINYLQGKDIVIHPACKNALREAAAWSWKRDKRTGKPIIGDPEEGNDHIWDAARYATEELMSHRPRFQTFPTEAPQSIISPASPG